MKRVERFIFYLLLFSIPFEVRLILAKWSIRFNEWMSAFLYGTDLLIGVLFLFWIWNFIIKKQKLSLNRSDFALLAFFIISGFSLFRADNLNLGIYQLIKLAEFIGFYFYVRSAFTRGVINIRGSMGILIISGVFQAIIGMLQYAKQSSLGLKYLGETVLLPSMSGVAVVVSNGEKFLRSYGTMLHPNILASFLFLAIFSFYFLYFYRSGAGISLRWPILYIPLLFGFLFTFSRVIIGLWGLGVIIRTLLVIFKLRFWILLLKTISRVILVISITLIISGIFAGLFYPQIISRLNVSSSDQAVSLRVWYDKLGAETIKENLFGVGLGNFVTHLKKIQPILPYWQYQPVHNIYLLIGAENGILALGLFLLFLFLLSKEYFRTNNFKKLYQHSFFLIFSSFLIISFFDHFLWTSQAGNLMFWLVLSLIKSVDGPITID